MWTPLTDLEIEVLEVLLGVEAPLEDIMEECLHD